MKNQNIPINIVGGTVFARYPKITTEYTLNMMVSGAKDIKALVTYMGHEKKLDFNSGQARGLYTSTRINRIIAVFGSSVYAITENLSSSLIGSLDTQTGNVYISENQNNQIALVDGSKVYIWNYNLFTFQSIIIPGIAPSYITFQDTYFIIADADSGIWQLSANNDGTIYDPLDRATMETDADNLQAVTALNKQIWVIGKKEGELWINLGRQEFPYVRQNTITLNYGIISNSTLATGFGMMVWLGSNIKSGVTILTSNGGTAKEISSDEGLHYLLNSLTTPEDSTAFLFNLDGHIIYQITFRTDNITITYDFTFQTWYSVTDENYNHHIAKYLTSLNNKLYFISYVDSSLYQCSLNFTTYNGATIPRARICQHERFADDDKFICNRVNLQIENGYNEVPGRIDLSISKDGGYTYGTIVPYQMQPQGKRISMVKWWKLGMANDLTFQFKFWSPDRFVVTSGSMDINTR